MTNIDKWRTYLKDIPAPNTWIDLGWYYAVNAALQRRVWFGNLKDEPLFPNFYTVLIGPPATGKGLVLRPVTKLLKHWTKNPSDQNQEPGKGTDHVRLIPVGPDATTYEKLCEDLADCTTTISTIIDDKKQTYTHASLAFCLEELNSLFKRHSPDIPKLLLRAFDYNDYEYKTKHQGVNLIRKICLNILAGTTVAMLREAESFHIFDDGFTSRTIFSFEHEPRHKRFFIHDESEDPEVDRERERLFKDLLDWIRKLTNIFGRLTYEPGVKDYLNYWHENIHYPIRNKASDRMRVYYDRKRVHLQKMAVAVHFSERLDMVITKQDIDNALLILHPIETKMAMGFSATGKNPLHPISRDIVAHLRTAGEATFVELLARFHHEVNFEELDTILQTLTLIGDISKVSTNNQDKYIIFK